MEEDKSKSEAQPEGGSLEAAPEDLSAAPTDQGGDNGLAAPDLANPTGNAKGDKPKQSGGLKKLLRKFNIYLLLFILLLVVAGAIAAITYLNSTKTPTTPDVLSQNLSQAELKQLDSSSAIIGGTGQTLTLQGDAIFTGQTLMRSNLAVAGDLKLGGNITAQDITASGTTNLRQTQVESLQVANSTILKDDVTLQKGLNVAGASSFSGPVTAKKITVTDLVLSGTAPLSVPNHIEFPGPPPARGALGQAALGSGGSASVSGSDTAGTINVNTGGNTAAGCFVTIKFNQPFTATPHVIISPVGQSAGATQYYVNRDKASMSLCVSASAPAHAQLTFDYFITD